MKVALTETGKLVKAATAIAKGRYYCPHATGHYDYVQDVIEISILLM